MSMISELVKELREASDWHYHNTDQDLGTLLDKSADTIEMLSEKARADRPTWIPCSERLPKEEKKSYWVCADGGYQYQCRWTNINHFWTDLTTDWHWHKMDVPQHSKVVAWMPLPAPYGGESNG